MIFFVWALDLRSFILMIAFILSLQCKKKAEQEAVKVQRTRQAEAMRQKEPKDLPLLWIDTQNLKKTKRFLEYRATVQMEGNRIIDLLREIPNIIEDGFILKEKINQYQNYQYLFIQMIVDKRFLHQTLDRLAEFGTIKHIDISTIDHTGDIVLQSIKKEFYEKTKQPKTVSKKDQLAIIDRLIAYRFEKWKLEDKLHWATITIHYYDYTKKRIDRLDIPSFQNYAYRFLEIGVEFIYLMLFLLPFIAAIFAIILVLKKAYRRFIRKA